MSAAPPVVVLGRFPPPLDGQTLATERMAELVAQARPVVRLSTSAPEGDRLRTTEARWDAGRAAFYLRLRRRIARALAAWPGAPVLWASVSPHPLGHARDAVATLPMLGDRPLVAVVHRAYFGRMFRNALTRRSAERLVRRCQRVVFLTEGLAERAAPFVPAARRAVIPNTVGGDVLPSADEVAARVAGGAGAPARLLFLGNMMPEKGYLHALETARRLTARGVPTELDLVGRWLDDADRADFDRAVGAAGLRGRIRAWGGVADRAEVRRRLLDADVLVFPSTHPSEALPVAVLEALGAGTPVVGARWGGLPEVVRDGVEGALVAPVGDIPGALADGVQAVLADWPRHARAARARFDAAFGPDAVRARWLSVLQEAEAAWADRR